MSYATRGSEAVIGTVTVADIVVRAGMDREVLDK